MMPSWWISSGGTCSEVMDPTLNPNLDQNPKTNPKPSKLTQNLHTTSLHNPRPISSPTHCSRPCAFLSPVRATISSVACPSGDCVVALLRGDKCCRHRNQRHSAPSCSCPSYLFELSRTMPLDFSGHNPTTSTLLRHPMTSPTSPCHHTSYHDLSLPPPCLL